MTIGKRPTRKNPQLNNNSSRKVTMAEVRAQWGELIAGGATPEMMASLGYAYNNSPYIQNQRVKRVSSLPFAGNRDSIEKALGDIENSEQTLRQASYSLFSNYSFMKLNSMYANILTYRNYFYSKYTTPKDIKSEAYKKERRRISRWVDLLQPKRTFQKIVEKAQWEGKLAYYMRDSVVEGKDDFDYVYLQHLPSDYVKIVGWNTASEFTIMFDFTYFWQAGTSPEQFPPIFKKYYEELKSIIPNKNARPNPNFMEELAPDVQMYYKNNRWFYWRTLPQDECFTFSQTEALPYQIPNTIGLFLQAKDLQDYSYLQQELLQLPLSGVVTGTLPMVKDAGGTTATDNYGISSGAFEFFTDMFNQAAPKGIQLFLSPATNHQFFKFDSDVVNNSTVVTNAIQQFNSVAGVGGLNSTTDKPNMAQVKTQQTLEAAYAERMYEQFINCIQVWWKNKLKTKFEWRFVLKGDKFSDSNSISNVQNLVSLGQNYMLPELLSYYGLTIDDVQSMQDEVIASEVYNKFQVVQSAYTQSKQTRINNTSVSEQKIVDVNDKGGRPTANPDNIESDGTASAIQNGTNTAEGRQMSKIEHCAECGEVLKDCSHYPFCSEDCRQENIERLGIE